MIGQALAKLRPGAWWRLVDEPQTEAEYLKYLEWNSDQSVPTWSEIQQVIPIIQSEYAKKQVEKNRLVAYEKESDPLFFKAQRGEATTEEWLAKVAEIKDRFPYQG